MTEEKHSGTDDRPHEIDAEAGAELDEEIEHLADVGGVAVGVQQGGGRPGVPDVDGDDLVPALCSEAEDVDVAAAAGGELGDGEAAARLVGGHGVGWGVWRKESEPGGDRRRDSAHLRRRGLIKPGRDPFRTRLSIEVTSLERGGGGWEHGTGGGRGWGARHERRRDRKTGSTSAARKGWECGC